MNVTLSYLYIILLFKSHENKSTKFHFGVYLLNQFNTLLKIHAEINEGPFNAFSLVFFLFKYEHVMVEELLQFFVSEVDTQLFETVIL